MNGRDSISSAEPQEAPLIVRIGGLPAEAVAPFASDLATRAAELRRLDDALAATQSQLVERLHEAIHGAAQTERGRLLAAKRDAFNRRSLRRYENETRFPPRVATALREALDREADLAAAGGRFETSHSARFAAEREALLDQAGETRFLRGVAMSSALLAERAPLLRRGGRRLRESRMLPALLRYVSRAALKLSPFSTLTPVGLGSIAPGRSGGAGLELAAEASWTERSLVSVHRSFLERLAHLLLPYEPFRLALQVGVNPSLEPLPAGRYTYLRPARWEVAEQEPHFRYEIPSRVKVDLRGPVVERLLARPDGIHPSYAELIRELQAELADLPPEEVRETLDRLAAIGLLTFYWPWEACDPAPEARLLDSLSRLDAREDTAALRASLGRVAEVLTEFPTSPSPGALLAEGRERLRAALRAAAELGGADREVADPDDKEWSFHEDVFLAPTALLAPLAPAAPAAPAGAPIATLHPAQSAQLLASLTPMARLAELFSLRHDFLHTLGAFAGRTWPGRSSVTFLEFFEASYPLFQDLVRFHRANRLGSPFKIQVFNPLELPVLKGLLDDRSTVVQALDGLLEEVGAEIHLSVDRLTSLLDTLPAAYTRSRDFCAFLQPTDRSATRWALNHTLEGVGRMASRYTPAMDGASRERFTSFYRARSQGGDGIHSGRLCDLFWPGGQSVNVHAYQTELVLELPGQLLSLPAERRVRLTDLRVRLAGDDGLPGLIDKAGATILPLHLGALAFRYLPSLAKFLALFGPGEFRSSGPAGTPIQEGDLEVMRRHAIGNVVYRRRNWKFLVAPLRERLKGLAGSAAYLAIDRWRSERGIPDRAYLAEPIPGTGPLPRLKPQFIDFTSVLFVELFQAALGHDVESLKLFEALPAPGDHLPAGDGSHRAVEIQLDSFGLSHPVARDERRPFRLDGPPATAVLPFGQPVPAEGTLLAGTFPPEAGH